MYVILGITTNYSITGSITNIEIQRNPYKSNKIKGREVNNYKYAPWLQTIFDNHTNPKNISESK